jgi:prophage regulatory protein
MTQLEATAQAVAPADRLSPAWREAPEILDGGDIERLTGINESTTRYWAFKDRHAAPGAPRLLPPSFKIGRRRVWRKEAIIQWLADQEKAASAGVA